VNFLEAIKLDRYNANRAPLFIAFVARFRFAMFNFFKTVERKGERGMERRRMISGGSRQISKRQLWSILNDAAVSIILYYSPHFLS
jgi:hypothetical protein